MDEIPVTSDGLRCDSFVDRGGSDRVGLDRAAHEHQQADHDEDGRLQADGGDGEPGMVENVS